MNNPAVMLTGKKISPAQLGKIDIIGFIHLSFYGFLPIFRRRFFG
jgi:hypothetical protein